MEEVAAEAAARRVGEAERARGAEGGAQAQRRMLLKGQAAAEGARAGAGIGQGAGVRGKGRVCEPMEVSSEDTTESSEEATGG
eukprot:1148805-Pelagomonas_calceolata.AAC.2